MGMPCHRRCPRLAAMTAPRTCWTCAPATPLVLRFFEEMKNTEAEPELE
jgi:hypothetical protein